MLLERVVTHSPTIPFNRNSNSSNPEDSENGPGSLDEPWEDWEAKRWKQLGGLELLSKQKATFKQQKDNVHPLLWLRRLRWPEQSVLGQQTLVSGHLEFSLKNCLF